MNVALLLGLLAMQTPANLTVDPLLIVQADEIWSVVGRRDNSVWPGWDARRTPLLIYFPGGQDLLINHPHPPADFRRYEGPVKSKAGAIFLRDGKTTFNLDGQNTSTSIGGVETLVVADTLSTRRQWAEGLAAAIVADPATADKTVGDSLVANSYPTMLIFAHEAFHVYQRAKAPLKTPHEMDLIHYDSLNVENNVGYALEADALADALTAKDDSALRQAALRWLAVRQDRRQGLTKDARDYEDTTEFVEGLAKYVEYRTLEVLEGRRPDPKMWLVQGFRGYKGLSAERARMIRQMQGYLGGTSAVNGDLYGASPVRFRLYFSGMAVGALLDRLRIRWHDRIFAGDASLTALAEEALHATEGEKSAALGQVHAGERYTSLVREKKRLAENGKVAVAEAVKAFDLAPGELIIDFSELKSPNPSFGYTSFGILRIDDDRNLFRFIPTRGNVGAMSFSEDGSRAVLYDRKSKTIHLQLTALPSAPKDEGLEGGGWELPGVSLKNVHGKISLAGRKVILRLTD